MSEEKRYMDEEWNDLPLPDGETAWQKMELLLDKDKKRRRVIPFWLWRYAGWGLALIGLAVGTWLWLKRTDTKDIVISTLQEETLQKPGKEKTTIEQPENITNRTKQHSKEEQPQTVNTKKTSEQPGTQERTTVKEKQTIVQRRTATTQQAALKSKAKSRVRTKLPGERMNNDLPLTDVMPVQQNPQQEKIAFSSGEPKDSLKTLLQPKRDTTASTDTGAKKAAEPMVGNEPKQDSQNDKSMIVFSAGVGMQQAISLNNQQSSSYNYNGKRSTALDLIPSVYLRLQKSDWFAQAEFQYAAPQPVEQFSFSQKTRYDAASLNVNTERFSIQKLYYHQLSFSLNYHVLENWSVGAGTMYNMLAGAVTEQETESKNVQLGTTTISRNLAPVKGYKDSFLYKTTAGILLQTDYHWKRFSLGMRFTQHLQPFIKYTTPDGAVMDEKNKVLQAVLRFRLF